MPYSVRPLRRRYLSNTPSVSPESAPPSRAAVGLRHGPGRLRRRDGPPLAAGQAAVRRAPRLHATGSSGPTARAARLRTAASRRTCWATCGAETGSRRATFTSSAIRCAATAFNTSTSASVCADPRCSMSRDPCRDFHTTWTRPPPTRSAPSAHTPRAHPPRPAASAQLPSSETANHLVEAMIISASSSTWPKSGPTPAPITIH